MKTAVASRQARPSRTDKNGGDSGAMRAKKIWRSRYLYLAAAPRLSGISFSCMRRCTAPRIAFRDFTPALGITGGKWVASNTFIQFFKSEYFVRLMKKSRWGISVYSIVVGFPIPVILALLMNEVRSKYFKKAYRPSSICRISFPPSLW